MKKLNLLRSVMAAGLVLISGCARTDGSNNLASGISVIAAPRTLLSNAFSGVTCGLRSGGSAWCWGNHSVLEPAAYTFSGPAIPYSEIPGALSSIAVGPVQTCAIAGGNLSCYGYSDLISMANSSTAPFTGSFTPAGTSGPYSAVSVGYYTACAIQASGTVQCWGWGGNGALGDGLGVNSASAVTVKESARDSASSMVLAELTGATDISVSPNGFACALLSSKHVSCWGNNNSGQLGIGTTESALAATPVLGLSDALQIATGTAHACALHSDGGVSCWGRNDNGQLGDESTTQRLAPARVTIAGVPLSGAVQIAAGEQHTCALLLSGEVMCWGSNANAQIGISPGAPVSVNSTPLFVLVPQSGTPTHLAGVKSVSASGFGTCAQLTDDSVDCLGKGADGSGGDTPVPTPVSAFAATGAPTKLGMKVTSTLGALSTVCLPVTVFLRNANGDLADASLNTSIVTANLSASGTDGSRSFYSDSACTAAVISVAIGIGTNSAQTYFKTTGSDVENLSATDSGSVLSASDSAAIWFLTSND